MTPNTRIHTNKKQIKQTLHHFILGEVATEATTEPVRPARPKYEAKKPEHREYQLQSNKPFSRNKQQRPGNDRVWHARWPHWTPSDMTCAEAEWWHEKIAMLIADGLDEDVAENRVLFWYYQQHPGKQIIPCLLTLEEVNADENSKLYSGHAFSVTP